MDLNKCLNCQAMCCRLYIDVSREEYNSFEKRGMSDSFVKESDKFIAKNPKHKGKEKQIDSMFIEAYAELKKDSEGICIHLNKETRLCGIYDHRPQACRDFQIDSNKCKKLYKCIS
jgi:Fe-S-cluster containining protein